VRAHENPFRTSRVQSLRFREGPSVPALVAVLRSRGNRGAIVGPEGSGKSTLLREISEHLRNDGSRVRVVRFDDSGSLAAALVDRDTIWLIDGAERIAPAMRIALVTVVRQIVITAHGWAAGLPILFQCQTSVTLLNELLVELGAPSVSPEDADDLFRRSDGNLRLVFRSLYDAAAQDFVGAFRAR
jgi:ABC-type molybdenum transport system ATPase subunit/photorepair protein PhrA